VPVVLNIGCRNCIFSLSTTFRTQSQSSASSTTIFSDDLDVCQTVMSPLLHLPRIHPPTTDPDGSQRGCQQGRLAPAKPAADVQLTRVSDCAQISASTVNAADTMSRSTSAPFPRDTKRHEGPKHTLPALSSGLNSLHFTEETDGTPSLPGIIEPSTMETTAQVPEATTTFELFPKLPPELSSMIWSFTTLKRRVVEIYHRYLPLQRAGSFDIPLVVRHNLTPLLSVCHESRALALTLLPTTEASSYNLPKDHILLFSDMLAFRKRVRVTSLPLDLWTPMRDRTTVLAIHPKNFSSYQDHNMRLD
jgi:hypothetical protein